MGFLANPANRTVETSSKTHGLLRAPSPCFTFSFSSGPPTKCSSTARQRKVCARFAQGFDCSARQVPETGEQMILANQGQNRAQASRKLMRKLGLPEPPRAHAQPHVLFDSQHYSSLSYSFLSSYFSFLFFTFLRQFNLMYLCTSSSKAHRASDVDWFWDIRRTAYHCVLMRHVHQKCIE